MRVGGQSANAVAAERSRSRMRTMTMVRASEGGRPRPPRSGVPPDRTAPGETPGAGERDARPPRVYTTAQGLSNNTIRDIHEDRGGNIWVGTDFGLNRIHPDG